MRVPDGDLVPVGVASAAVAVLRPRTSYARCPPRSGHRLGVGRPAQ